LFFRHKGEYLIQMKPLLLIIGCLLFSLPLEALTRAEANAIVIEEVIVPHPLSAELVAYSYNPPGAIDRVFQGDIIHPFVPAFTLEVEEEAWLFWIDLAPNQWFEHPCLIVLLKDADASLQVFESLWFPVVSGKQLYATIGERNNSPDIFWGDPVPPLNPCVTLPIEAPGGTANNRWAVLATGPKEHPVADLDVELMQSALQNTLTGPGIPASNFSLPKGSKEELFDLLASIGQQPFPPQQLYFHWTGHGNSEGIFFGHPFMANTLTTWQELIDQLLLTQAEEFYISIESCRSGGGMAPLCASLNGNGVTSTDALTFAYFTETGSIFTTAFAVGLTIPEADSDANEKVSYTEAWEWATANCTAAAEQQPLNWEIALNTKLLSPPLEFDVFPNPTGGEAWLQLQDNTEKARLQIISEDGTILVEQEIPAGSQNRFFSIDLSGFRSGIYLVRLNTPNQSGRQWIVKR
jgi:hypothetical protein